MPYISNKEGRRDQISEQLFLEIDKKGELNFIICQVIQEFLAGLEDDSEGFKIGYDVLSDVAGVLGDVQHEFRRCVMDKYEDKKREENGDVWWINERLNEPGTMDKGGVWAFKIEND